MTPRAVHPLTFLRGAEPQLVRLMWLYLAMKASLIAVGLLAGHLLPFNWGLYRTNLLLDIQQLPDWMRPFNTWDTQHYIFLAENGYGVNPMSNAFYPLYPYLIWLTAPLFAGKPLIAAWVVANLVSFLVPVYLYKVARLFFSETLAFRSAMFQLAFPTAFFLSVGYSEATYLALCLMAFYYVFVKDLPKACLFSFLLPLARAQALLFVLPIGVLFLEQCYQGRADMPASVKAAFRAYAPPAVATLLGMAVYFGLCRWLLGGYFDGLKAQQLYVSNNSVGNLLNPYRWFMTNFVDISLQLHTYSTSMIDRAAFILFAPMLIGIYFTQNKALFVYALSTLLIPAMAGTFMSYTRVLMVVFPISIYLGTRSWRTEYLMVPMFALQILFYLMHTGGYWVA